jgi:hypothetical protein
MRYLLILGILGMALIAGLLFTRQSAAAQTAPTTPAGMSGPAGSTSPASPNALTSFLISNPYCYQPDPSLNQCYINFRYIQATDNQSSAPYMVWLAITIGGKTRYTGTAFFEGTINYSYDMVPGGLKVPCGAPNAGGAGTAFGFQYSVAVSPLDSSRAAMSTDTANVTCPAFAP